MRAPTSRTGEARPAPAASSHPLGRRRSLSPAAYPALAAALALLLLPGRGRADDAADVDRPPSPPPAATERPPRLTLDFSANAWATGGMLLAVGASQYWSDRIAPPHCRWCDPPQVDRWARNTLKWNDIQAATTASNALVVAIPIGAATALGLWAHAEGDGGRVWAEDLLVVTEAASVTMVLMQVAKFSTARLRPDAWGGSGSTTANSRMSFFAGHAAVLFSVAASTTQLLRLRGRPGWGWFTAVAFVGAASCAYFRVASDNHWLTDVVAGAAVGTAVGLTLPGMVLYRAHDGKPAVTMFPAPGGFALVF